MKKIETYGINVDVESLRRAAAQTVNWPKNTGRTVIGYDPEDGAVICHDLVGESYLVWRTPAFGVMSTTRHVSAQHIMDEIRNALRQKQ